MCYYHGGRRHSLPCTAPGVRLFFVFLRDLGNTTEPGSTDSSLVLVGMDQSRFVLHWHVQVYSCLSLRVTLRLTAHIHFSQYTTFCSPRLCCGISSIPCPRPGYDWYARQAFQRAYSWVCNLSRPFASSQLNQVRKADTRFLPDVGRRHVRPTNSHIFRAKNLIPRRSHLNENRNS